MIRSPRTIVALCALPALLLYAACNGGNNGKNENPENADTSSTAATDPSGQATTPESTATPTKFDINTIPVSDHDLGAFPFFSMPEGLKEQNKPVQKKFDRLFFPIDGVMTPVEGRVYKTNVVMKSGGYDDWSLPFFEKSYDDAITAVGGVKIFDGKITNEEYERYHEQASYLGEDGSIGYTGENIKVYVIHRTDGGDVYIQLTGNTAGGKLDILQKEAFKQTITMLKADQIQKDLAEKGKAILYINFDVDKATLQPDGKEAVNEIVKALNSDKDLKLSIEGHTDNTGSAAHNKQLSADRANTVMNELTAAGIDKSRLKATGYGAERPLVANDSDANKAKNRRVELVKM